MEGEEEQPVITLPGDHLMIYREGFGMARELFHTEQLRTQRRFPRAGT